MINRESLRYKINFTITLTLLAVTIVFGTALAVYENQRRKAAIEQIISSLNDLTSKYSEQLGNEIFATQVIAIQTTIADIIKREGLLSVSTYNEFGELVVSTENDSPKELPKKLLLPNASTSNSAVQKWHDHSVLTFTSPIMAYEERVGFWQINYSLATLDRQTLEIIFIFVTLILSIATVIGVLLNSILLRIVLNPVYMLRDAMQHIQGHDVSMDSETGMASGFKRLDKMVQAFDELPDALVNSSSTGNEISSLANSFRQMLLALKNAYIGIRTDALTGLNNRMKLNETLEDELKLAQRYQSTFSIVLLDIDYFKKVNDIHGHLVGDDVLKKMAALLELTFRTTDTPGRWGGEEFLIVLPRQEKVQAIQTAERLRAIIEIAEFPSVGKITASFGVTEYAPEDTMESLLKRADDALYKAKFAGRNCVQACSFNEVSEEHFAAVAK